MSSKECFLWQLEFGGILNILARGWDKMLLVFFPNKKQVEGWGKLHEVQKYCINWQWTQKGKLVGSGWAFWLENEFRHTIFKIIFQNSPMFFLLLSVVDKRCFKISKLCFSYLSENQHAVILVLYHKQFDILIFKDCNWTRLG